jgi:hypothetical protein
MADGERFPTQRPGCRTRLTDGVSTVIGPEGQRYVVNETALAVWELCDGVISPDEMVTAIWQLFDADQELIEADVWRVLGEFELNHLIQWVPDPGKDGDVSWPRSSSHPVETRERT